MKHLIFVFAAALSLAACNSSDDTNTSGTTAPHAFEGLWSAPAYGQTLAIEGDRLRIFDHTRDYCLESESETGLSAGDYASIFKVSDDGQQLTDPGFNGTLTFHAPATVYTKEDQLPQSCRDNLVQRKGRAGYQPNPGRDFELLWQTFDELYLSFERKNVDWNAQYAANASRAALAATDAALLDVLYDTVAPLADAHVHITAPGLGVASVNGKPVLIERLIQEYADSRGLALPLPVSETAGLNTYIGSQMALLDDIVADYADSSAAIHRSANDLLQWFEVDGIGYLQIRAMTGFADDAEDNTAEFAALENGLAQALGEMRSVSGLIVDVRNNNGGKDFLSMAIVRHFIDGPRHVFSKQARLGSGRTPLVDVTLQPSEGIRFLGPVALLTSNSTVSAAETFTLMMRSLPNVTLIGEATQGALSDSLEKKLPNGFEFTLSNEFYLSNTGEWFEGGGIPVDIEVPFFSQADRDEGADSGIETAFTWLQNQ
ncbi:MAG: S41 family peptidase [bacterium]